MLEYNASLHCICLVVFLHMNFETEITAIVKGIMLIII